MSLEQRKSRSNPKRIKPMTSLYSFKVPNIVIVGDKEIRRKINRIEQDFNLRLKFIEPEQLNDVIDSKTIAIIIDENKISPRFTKFLIDIVSDYKLLPTFYLSRSAQKANFYSALYQSGLHGVIDWPLEAPILHDLMIESLRPHPRATGNSKGDLKLSEMVKSHLVLNGKFKTLKVKVIEGFVFIEGSVKSLFEKETIENECSKVL